MNDDIQTEVIPGLPHALPPGESLVWQGHPQWKKLARHMFKLPWLAGYFLVFTVARGLVALQEGGVAQALLATAVVIPLAAACLGVLALLAWMHARATVYSITSHRVVMRFGVAFPVTFNLPFTRLAAADLSQREDGDGDIALQLVEPDRIGYVHLWPHARPWRMAKAQPMLRSIPRAGETAALLARTVAAWSAAKRAPVMVAAPPEVTPQTPRAVRPQHVGGRLNGHTHAAAGAEP